MKPKRTPKPKRKPPKPKATPKKHTGGRPAHVPNAETRLRAKALGGYGLTAEQSADVMGMCRATFWRYYKAEFQAGVPHANAQVAQNLFKLATGSSRGAVAAAIFWLKARGGWSEKVQVETTGVTTIRVVYEGEDENGKGTGYE
jgi:predicted DNA-binding protein (UPF0251 family)